MMSAPELTDAMRAALVDPDDVNLARLVDLNRSVGADSSTLIRTAWRALLDEPSIAPAAVAAIARSGALTGEVEPRVRVLVQDLVSALGTWRHEPARQVVERLWATPGPLGAPPRTRGARATMIAADDDLSLEC